jgi:hypothetical protein
VSFQLFNSHPKLKGIGLMKFSNIYYKTHTQIYMQTAPLKLFLILESHNLSSKIET